MQHAMQQPKRPRGVTAIAILAFVTAGLLILTVVNLAVTKAPLATLSPELAKIDLPPDITPQTLREILTALFLLSAALNMAVGRGLWTLRNWARRVMLFLAGINVVVNVFNSLQAATHANDAVLIQSLFVVFLNGWIFWFLIQPSTKEAFQAVSSPPPAMPDAGGPTPPDA